MLSQTTLIDLKKSLTSAIEMLERHNENLRKELHDFAPKSKKREMKDGYLKELDITSTLNGLHFWEVKKEDIDESSFKITADVDSNGEEFFMEVLIEASSKLVKRILINLEDTSTLTEIKPQLGSLIKDLNVSATLNSISSFTRMSKVRSNIIDELLSLHCGYFDVDVWTSEEDEDDESKWVITAHDRKKSNKCFELAWTLRWDPGRLTIVNVFTPLFVKDSIQSNILKKLLRTVLKSNYSEADIKPLIAVWREIGDAIIDF